MALTSITWARPKATATLDETLAPVAAIADAGDTAIVDIYASVNSANKVLVRVKLKLEKNGTDFRVGMSSLVFPGNATTYSAGGSTPADSAAVTGKSTPVVYSSTVDLDAFYSAAGDARADS